MTLTIKPSKPEPEPNSNLYPTLGDIDLAQQMYEKLSENLAGNPGVGNLTLTPPPVSELTHTWQATLH